MFVCLFGFREAMHVDAFVSGAEATANIIVNSTLTANATPA